MMLIISRFFVMLGIFLILACKSTNFYLKIREFAAKNYLKLYFFGIFGKISSFFFDFSCIFKFYVITLHAEVFFFFYFTNLNNSQYYEQDRSRKEDCRKSWSFSGS